MDKIAVVKLATQLVVGAGTKKIVKDIIKNNTEATEKATEQLVISVASYAIGGIVADATKKYMSTKIDNTVAFIDQAKEKFKNRNADTTEEIQTEDEES